MFIARAMIIEPELLIGARCFVHMPLLTELGGLESREVYKHLTPNGAKNSARGPKA